LPPSGSARSNAETWLLTAPFSADLTGSSFLDQIKRAPDGICNDGGDAVVPSFIDDQTPGLGKPTRQHKPITAMVNKG
jgi:hypothetical protein